MHPTTAKRLLWSLAGIGYAMAATGIAAHFASGWYGTAELLSGWGAMLALVMTAVAVHLDATLDWRDGED